MDKLITALGVLTLLSSTHVLGAESTTPPGQTTTVVNGPNNPVPMGTLGSGGTLVPISPTTPIPIGTLGADGSIKPVSPTAPIPMGTVGAHNGTWGMFTDVIYLKFQASESASRDFTIGNGGLPANASAALASLAGSGLSARVCFVVPTGALGGCFHDD